MYKLSNKLAPKSDIYFILYIRAVLNIHRLPFKAKSFIFGVFGSFGEKSKIMMMNLSFHFQCCVLL